MNKETYMIVKSKYTTIDDALRRIIELEEKIRQAMHHISMETEDGSSLGRSYTTLEDAL